MLTSVHPADPFQEIGAGPHRPPPASKEVVANLPIISVTEEILARLGRETQCAVCRENLVVNDKMQELPCKHLFHPPCLKPWLVIPLQHYSIFNSTGLGKHWLIPQFVYFDNILIPLVQIIPRQCPWIAVAVIAVGCN